MIDFLIGFSHSITSSLLLCLWIPLFFSIFGIVENEIRDYVKFFTAILLSTSISLLYQQFNGIEYLTINSVPIWFIVPLSIFITSWFLGNIKNLFSITFFSSIIPFYIMNTQIALKGKERFLTFEHGLYPVNIFDWFFITLILSFIIAHFSNHFGQSLQKSGF